MEKRSGIMNVVGGKQGGTTNQRGHEDDSPSRDVHDSLLSDDQYKEENPKVMKATL
jgi:hypothetical protein